MSTGVEDFHFFKQFVDVGLKSFDASFHVSHQGVAALGLGGEESQMPTSMTSNERNSGRGRFIPTLFNIGGIVLVNVVFLIVLCIFVCGHEVFHVVDSAAVGAFESGVEVVVEASEDAVPESGVLFSTCSSTPRLFSR